MQKNINAPYPDKLISQLSSKSDLQLSIEFNIRPAQIRTLRKNLGITNQNSAKRQVAFKWVKRHEWLQIPAHGYSDKIR